LKIGDTYCSTRDYVNALGAYEQIIRLNPNFVLANHRKGDALYGLKRYEEALSAYEQAIRLDPNSAIAHLGEGNALKDLKRYEGALSVYERCICPYCNTEMSLYDCKVISGIDGTVLVDPTQSRTLLLPSITGPENTRLLASRQCANPNCNRLLPHNMEFVDQNITIAILGDTFSGKTHYIASLVEQLRSGRYLPPGYEFCLLNPVDPNVEELYERDYYQPLFKRNQELQRTNRVFDRNAEPLIYELTLEGPTRKVVNLLIYDVEGGDAIDQRCLVSYRPHLLNAKGILFMADPWTIPGIYNKLASHLRPHQDMVAGRVITNILHSVIQVYQNNAGQRGRTHFTMPVALVIPKADLIPYLTVNPYYHDLFNPDHEHQLDIDSNSPINRIIQKLLYDLDEPDIVNMVKQLGHARFFVTSATGSNVDDATREFPCVKPYRCVDPLFWLLRELHIIN